MWSKSSEGKEKRREDLLHDTLHHQISGQKEEDVCKTQQQTFCEEDKNRIISGEFSSFDERLQSRL